jgi:hypothetical protein
MWYCKYCKKDFNYERLTEKANHSKYCSDNPKSKLIKEEQRKRSKKNITNKFGNNVEFQVECNKCKSKFLVSERENLFPQKEKYFCSRKCANSCGGSAKALKYHENDNKNYARIAWKHHKKECLYCGENKIVAVHHVNFNHYDNRPENLVPLCPTHHQYVHSRYKYLIEEKLNEYLKNKWG